MEAFEGSPGGACRGAGGAGAGSWKRVPFPRFRHQPGTAPIPPPGPGSRASMGRVGWHRAGGGGQLEEPHLSWTVRCKTGADACPDRSGLRSQERALMIHT